MLEEKYRLEKMELDLNKEKKALQLRTEIAKFEAKERACIGFTSANQIKEEGQAGFVTPPGPTRPNLQVWSERARSSLRLLGDRVRSSLQVSRNRHPLMNHFQTEPVLHRGSNGVEPVTTEPVRTEPVCTEPARTKPARTEPIEPVVHGGSNGVKPVRTEPV